MIDQPVLDKAPPPYSGVACLAMLARLHNVSVCAEQLSHRFGELDPVFAANESSTPIPCSASSNFGFVRADLGVKIEVEAFSFTQYRVIHSVVQSLPQRRHRALAGYGRARGSEDR